MKGDDKQTFWFRFFFLKMIYGLFCFTNEQQDTSGNILMNKPFVRLLFMNELGKWTVDVTNKRVR